VEIATTDIDGLTGHSSLVEGRTVVAIDVIRAFTTAAYAFDAGADTITCVDGLDQVRALAPHVPDAFLMGEKRGMRPEGFDAGNETWSFDDLDLTGRALLQSTSFGTHGLVAAHGAADLLAASAVTVGATARWIIANRPDQPVTLLCTSTRTSEDRSVADHLAALLLGEEPDPERLADRVRSATVEHAAIWTRPRGPDEVVAWTADVARCALVDHFDFALVAADQTVAGLVAPVLRAVAAGRR
jgi:2-phosphosulfolactate phosphatase